MKKKFFSFSIIIAITVTLLFQLGVVGAAETITVPISESLDDAWELDGFVYNTQRLDTEGVIGLRFTEIDIPPRSVITHAHIEMVFVEGGGGSFFDTWAWVASDVAPSQFVQVDYDITNRPRIQLAVPWNDDPALWVPGDVRQTPDLRDLVQKIVNRANFGGTVMFFVTPDRSDAVFASSTHSFYDGPQLVIDYIPPGQMYQVLLPSGGVGEIEMSATAGDGLITSIVGVLLVVAVFQELRTMAHKSSG